MKQIALLAITLLLTSPGRAVVPVAPKQPVDYVAPNIGSIGQLLTAALPFVQLPHGMARLVPVTTPGIQDRYLADKIWGFSTGAGMVMVSTGDVSAKPSEYASDFDHDFETVTPYYYGVDLQTWSAKAEMTATSQAGLYRFTLPASPHAHVILSLGPDAELTVIGSDAVEGSQRITGTVATAVDSTKETRLYFYAEFSKPFSTYQTWQDDSLSHQSHVQGSQIGFVTSQPSTAGEQMEVRVGISYISANQAKRNLERDTAGKSFDSVKEATRDTWNRALGKIDTVGGTERQRTIFYTALVAFPGSHDRYHRRRPIFLRL